ncbi:MAG: hypothetical protein IPQ09_26085 [Myxococcales bacterium]|nr:hypothetical protein [Myxococcales bacterium]
MTIDHDRFAEANRPPPERVTAACACRPVREGEAVYATELPPTAFPAAL